MFNSINCQALVESLRLTMHGREVTSDVCRRDKTFDLLVIRRRKKTKKTSTGRQKTLSQSLSDFTFVCVDSELHDVNLIERLVSGDGQGPGQGCIVVGGQEVHAGNKLRGAACALSLFEAGKRRRWATGPGSRLQVEARLYRELGQGLEKCIVIGIMHNACQIIDRLHCCRSGMLRQEGARQASQFCLQTRRSF